MKKTTLAAIAFALIVVGFVVYSTFHRDLVRVRACVTFNGRQDCRTASATSQQEALRTAVSNACAQIASGVSESTRCENTQPDSVDWLR